MKILGQKKQNKIDGPLGKIERSQTEFNVFRLQGAQKNKNSTHKKLKIGKIDKLQTELNDLRRQGAQKLADMERRITQDVRPESLN